MTSAPATTYSFEFYRAGATGPTSAAPFEASAYVVSVVVELHKPPLLPRLTPEQYRDEWVKACALQAIRLAYRRLRDRERIPDCEVVEPFVAVRPYSQAMRPG